MIALPREQHRAARTTMLHNVKAQETPCPCFSLEGKTLAFGGPVDRYRKNMAAIQLLRKLQMENRPATAKEQDVLAHYTAFGESALLNRAIDMDKAFADLTNEAERNAITRAALTAFYTPQEVVEIMWEALAPTFRAYPERIRMLEPAFGIGMFAACMPSDLRTRATITAVEMDVISSDIAALLHPDVNLLKATPFQEAALENDSFDLVITNVPFSGIKVFYPGFKDAFLKRCLHDFFIARSVELTRSGGIVCVLTSYGTMDKIDSRTREWLAERADLITAIRLPQGAFEANSGTLCGADVLLFQKK